MNMLNIHTNLLREANITAQDERVDPPSLTQARYSKHVRNTTDDIMNAALQRTAGIFATVIIFLL